MRLRQSQTGLSLYPTIVTPPPTPPPPAAPGPFVPVDLSDPFVRFTRKAIVDITRNTTLLEPGTAPAKFKIKWNPGHYTEFDTKLSGVFSATKDLSSIKAEINMMAGLANVKGYMIGVTWSNLQIAAGTAASSFTLGNLQALIDYIKSKGKRYAIQVIGGDFTNTHPNGSTSILPAFLQNGNTALYGTAGYRVAGVTTVVAGASGWWGGDGNGNTYGAALWRPNVMAEWINLHKHLGAIYDGDPACEAIYQGEDSFYQGTGSTNNSDYNDITQLNNWMNFLQAQCQAWPTTMVGFSETFLQFQQNSVTLTNNITNGTFPNHPPAMAQTDSLGAVQRSAIHSWGTKTYAGVTPGFGTLGDRRSLHRFIAEVQAPDQGFFQNLGSPREDVKAGLDIMGCTHAFWAIVPSPIAQHTLPNKYPCTFTANVTGLSGTLASPWPLNSGQYDLNTTPGGRGNFIKGSTAVTFTVAQTATTSVITIKYPLVPSNWFNGGTSTPAQNGTSTNYTDPGLGTWINDPANALINTAYPSSYPS